MNRPLPDAHDRARRRAQHDTYAPYEVEPAAYRPDADNDLVLTAWDLAIVAMLCIILATGIACWYFGIPIHF